MTDTDRTPEATEHTRNANRAVLGSLPFDDRRDEDDATRGFLRTAASFDETVHGVPVWDPAAYDFLTGQAPDTVNPSLWRQAGLNIRHGLFEVVPGVYQVRGFDLSNVTFVEGETGVVVIDPLITPTMAAKALAVYREERGDRPVTGVIYTHSHVDHYGGVKGIVDEADVDAGRVPVIAPAGFLAEAVSENVYAGNAMARRAVYQYGPLLPKGPTGTVDAGLGKTTSLGEASLIPPTDEVHETGETRTVDGVRMEFFMAPGTEAPAEFLVWFPDLKVLDTAEDATHTMHNLYTLRGAQVRDARAWWKALDGVLARWGGEVETCIAQHHWPTWGTARVVELIEAQRDLYKYLHDQTLHLANSGATMVEAAEQLRLPDAIGKVWANRGYYGSVNHNVKAVFQRYLGWYDSNPSHLWQLPPTDAAARYVEAMGGADAVVARGKEAFEAGDYRWVAELCDRVVFADPSNRAARELGARALEQLGFQQENPTWRNEFLVGAQELRQGPPSFGIDATASPDVVAAMTPEMMLDYLGIRLDGPRAAASPARTIHWELGGDLAYRLQLRNGVLVYRELGAGDRQSGPAPDAVLTAAKNDFAAVVTGGVSLDDALASGSLAVDGDADAVRTLFGLLVVFPGQFNVVEP